MAGEMVIIEGTQKVRPGAPVKPVTATSDAKDDARKAGGKSDDAKKAGDAKDDAKKAAVPQEAGKDTAKKDDVKGAK